MAVSYQFRISLQPIADVQGVNALLDTTTEMEHGVSTTELLEIAKAEFTTTMQPEQPTPESSLQPSLPPTPLHPSTVTTDEISSTYPDNSYELLIPLLQNWVMRQYIYIYI